MAFTMLPPTIATRQGLKCPTVFGEGYPKRCRLTSPVGTARLEQADSTDRRVPPSVALALYGPLHFSSGTLGCVRRKTGSAVRMGLPPRYASGRVGRATVRAAVLSPALVTS